NMFHTDADSTKAANLSLIFDYLQVPSQFVGTRTELNPTFFWQLETNSSPETPAGSLAAETGTVGLHPPFSAVSNYRDPGRINLNTIAGLPSFTLSGTNWTYQGSKSDVWNAILGGDPQATGSIIIGPSFEQFTQSRRGNPATQTGESHATIQNPNDPVGVGAWLDPSPYTMYPDPVDTRYYTIPPALNSLYPSVFSNAFRSSQASDERVPLVGDAIFGTPPVDLRHDHVDATNQPIDHPIDSTIFRQGINYGQAPIPPSGVTPPTASQEAFLAPNLGTVSVQPYNKYDRNPYFAYEALGRNLNKLTTHSNVFAVWVTVGYFEVTPWYGFDSSTGAAKPATTSSGNANPQVFDTGHPDGYQLGAEIGSDTGQIERHRGFYIIDRSIPVGFQRGVDNNTGNAIILKRFIE
ncbi:MAG TPA: hypothetical protein VGI75_14250, partial [Pirellulales bacterium]